MQSPKALKFITILLHLLLWAGVWLFYIYFFSYATQDQRFIYFLSTSLLPITIVATYLVSYYLIPQFLLKKNVVLFIVYLIYVLVGILFLIIIVSFINFMFLSNFDMDKMPLLTRNFFFLFVLVFMVVSIVSFVQMLRQTTGIEKRNSILQERILNSQIELKERELHYLKEQIHPHFLFNTLNTIYGSALKESKDTPDLILKLSNLLDYTLNQIKKKTVPISEEVQYIESYIGLEQVRFRDILKVSFTKNIEQDIQVPPMLFIAFIENAFKHGEAINDILQVEISINVDKNQLHFTTKNTVKKQQKLTDNHGLGIENTKKRLDVLYPDSYQLTSEIRDNCFLLTLIINFD